MTIHVDARGITYDRRTLDDGSVQVRFWRNIERTNPPFNQGPPNYRGMRDITIYFEGGATARVWDDKAMAVRILDVDNRQVTAQFYDLADILKQ